MKKIILLLLCAANVALAQKKNTGPMKPMLRKTPPNIVGVWELNYIQGADAEQLFKGNMPRIAIDPKRIMLSGNNSCNQFSGQIKIDGNKIIFVKPFVQTEKYCEGQAEERFMEVLSKVKTFSFSEANKLDLIAGDIGVLQFTKVIKDKDAPKQSKRN